MPSIVVCPECQQQLNLPDEYIGKRVRCPGCKAVFTAATNTGSAAVTPSPPPPPVPPPPGPGDAPVRKRRRPVEEEEEDQEEAEDNYEEDRPRRRKKKRPRREYAMSRVAGPAISLMIVGGVAIGLSIISLILNLLGGGVMAVQMQGQGEEQLFAQAVGGVLGAIFGVCWGGIVLSGALQMKNLKSYGYGMTACIVAMLPCTGCCLLGLPFGIWGLVALNDPDVKSAF